MFHFVSITCIYHTEDTPALSAGNYDVSAKVSCYEVRHYHYQNLDIDLQFLPQLEGPQLVISERELLGLKLSP